MEWRKVLEGICWGGLEEKIIEHHLHAVKKSREYCGDEVMGEDILAFLADLRGGYSEYHVANIIKGLKRFFRDYFQ